MDVHVQTNFKVASSLKNQRRQGKERREKGREWSISEDFQLNASDSSHVRPREREGGRGKGGNYDAFLPPRDNNQLGEKEETTCPIEQTLALAVP